ncbi:MAG: glycosyltransferase [Lutibacter sp.]|nr:glycosyltransferase [Lutibacter sp.]
MIKKEIDISVVMAVYKNDTALFFSDAIISLLNQTYLPSEIVIVIDGFVNQEIEDVLQKYCNNDLFKIIRLPKNKGLANALNVGIISAKHGLIARMDADDICFPDRFEKQVNYLRKENLDFVGGQMIEFGKDISDIISERKVPYKHEDIIKFMKYRAPFSHPTILFKKSVFDSLNGYDVNIFPEDYDFFVRVYLNDFKMGNVKDNVLWFRLGENLSEALRRRWGKAYAKNEYKLYKKYLKLGFYNRIDFLKAVMFKIPLRILPFPIFKFIYYKISR